MENRNKKGQFIKGIPAYNKGKKTSEKTKEKLRKIMIRNGIKPPSRKGEIPWNKGKTGLQVSWNKGKKYTNEQKKNMIGSHKGYKPSIATRKKLSESNKGEKAPFWRGGITPINKIIRGSLEYRLWQEAIKIRDNYTCVFCGTRGGNLHSDHIKRFSEYPELRFAIDNGRTLCENCHKKTDNWGTKGLKGRKYNYKV